MKVGSRILGLILLIATLTSHGHAAPLLEEVHFLIPAGPGGGWDGTARGVGEALNNFCHICDFLQNSFWACLYT